jgi:hypothetical protein
MDDNLTRLEGDAASKAVRYARIAAIGVAVLALAGVGLLIYRRTRKPSLRERLDEISLDRLRTLMSQLKEEMPALTLRINEKAEREPGTMESIIRRVAPTIVATASTALLERVTRPPEPGKRDRTQPVG